MYQSAQFQGSEIMCFTAKEVGQSLLQTFADTPCHCSFIHHRDTAMPSSCNATRIADTYLGSITTAFPNVIRSGGRYSSIKAKPAGEMGRSRNSERWFSQTKSHCVGEVPDVAYALSFIVSLSGVFAGRRTTVNSTSLGWWQRSVLPS